MISVLKKALDTVLGAGEAAVTVPPLDGAFQPNTALEAAAALAALPAPDNLVREGDRILLSCGADVLAWTGEGTQAVARFSAPVSALAADDRAGLAVALAGQGLVLQRAGAPERTVAATAFAGAGCITAMAFAPDGGLIVTCGSRRHGPDDWARNLLERACDGAVWRIDPASGEARRIAGGLGWPAGLLVGDDGTVVVSEAWRHRLVALPAAGGAPKVLADNLPAYPGRLVRQGAEIWLCCFAPRSQLMEFVLREKTFRTRMVAEVPAAFWVAPALASGRSFREPLQGGAVKQLGVLKPWAPTRSYGLLVCLDTDFHPRRSFHSRADGSRHGITSVLPAGDGVLVTSRGGDVLLRLAAATTRAEDAR